MPPFPGRSFITRNETGGLTRTQPHTLNIQESKILFGIGIFSSIYVRILSTFIPSFHNDALYRKSGLPIRRPSSCFKFPNNYALLMPTLSVSNLKSDWPSFHGWPIFEFLCFTGVEVGVLYHDKSLLSFSVLQSCKLVWRN